MDALGPLILVAMVVAFYFLLVRPQNRRVQERQRLVSSLSIGDGIVTAGGFHGRIVALHEEAMDLEIAPGTTVRVERTAAVRVVEETGGEVTGTVAPDTAAAERE